MIRACIHARLGADPVQRETKTGNAMTTVSVAVDVNRLGEAAEVEWFSVIAFGRPGAELALCRKGEPVALMGQLTKSRYAGRDGVERCGWTLTLDGILSAHAAQPPGGLAALREDPLPQGVSTVTTKKTGIRRPERRRSHNLPVRGAPDDAHDDLYRGSL
jgi:single-strand DNA-binding protein